MAVLCRNCSGKLIFEPSLQKLQCVSCGSIFDPEDVSDENAERHSKYYDANVYVCSHCGAEVIITGSEASTFCAYCGNPAIVFNRVSKELKPDGLIPFKITKEQALGLIRSKIKENRYIPDEIKALGPDHLKGIYIPYWVVTADFKDSLFIRGRVKNRGRKGSHDEYFAKVCECRFNSVPVDGSRMLSDAFSMKLEPFDFTDAKVFDEDYLSGFYSNVSDLSYQELRSSAADRCHKLLSEEVLKHINAHSPQVEDHIAWIDIEDGSPYLLIPVWFFTFIYEGKPYTILINGQTGKVVGTFPWIMSKFIRTMVLITVPLLVAAVFFFAGFFNRDLLAVSHVFQLLFTALVCIGPAMLTRGLVGLRKIRTSLDLSRSESAFKFVNRRKG